jgi:hypothetical protein
MMEKCYLYIVLTRTNTALSRLIRLVTSDDYTHAALSLDKDLEQMYSFGRRSTYNPFIGRFKHEDLNDGIYKISKTLPGVVLEIEVPKDQYEQARNLLNDFIENSHRYKYNYRGLIFSMLNRPVQYDYRFLCSEFVYYILRESGITDFNVSGNLVRPQNFLNLDCRIIYKGDLKELKTSKSESLPIWSRLLSWHHHDIEHP